MGHIIKEKTNTPKPKISPPPQGLSYNLMNELLYNSPWDIFSVLKQLSLATDILLKEKHYTSDEWEKMDHANKRAKELLELI